MPSDALALCYQQVKSQITQAAQQCGRSPEHIHLLAVSKTQSADTVRALYQLGQTTFGENYLQEALVKIDALNDLNIEWHFIGHVQRNKTKSIADYFDWVHGVDRLIIAQRLSLQRPEQKPPLNLCLQVNIDQQQSKDGCDPEEVAHLVSHISALPRVRLRGLMIIPRPEHTQAFEQAQQLFEHVRSYHQQPQQWDTLSMGMSADLQQAISHGSTLVRVGTALFGQRS